MSSAELERAAEAESEDGLLVHALGELFRTGELHLDEDKHGWVGYTYRNGVFRHRDTREPQTWVGRVRISPGAVKVGIERAIAAGWSP